ncbi:taste receptor type 1 member 1-like [Gastrophryne carolinensis]
MVEMWTADKGMQAIAVGLAHALEVCQIEISYSASSKRLSVKHLYPSFFRTIPSDNVQMRAMLSLLQKFNWTWVAIVGSEDVYGKQGLQDLYTLLTNNNICIPYQGLITSNRTDIQRLLAGILQTQVNVTLVLSDAAVAKIFFSEVIKANITDAIWIGSEDWSAEQEIAALEGILSVGSILGVSLKQIDFQKLVDFEMSYVSSTKSKDTPGCYQACNECQSFTIWNMSKPSRSVMSASFNVYSAVYAIAHGLHGLLNCDSGECSNDTFYPWQLLKHMKNTNFTVYNQSVYFDDNGDLAMGYDIIMWVWNGDSPTFQVIGSYSDITQELELDDGLQWFTQDNSVPKSLCSRDCGKGERRVQTGSHICCFNCVPCPAMTFLNTSDVYSCQPCEFDQWSPIRSESCYMRTVEYLSWTAPLSFNLLFIVTLLLLVISFMAAIFMKNLNTPVVKSAGGKMCLVMLLSLAVSCSTLYCYFGKPGVVTCMLRQPIFAVSFTICFSCIVTHSFQIVCIFKMASKMPRMYDLWVKKNGSNVFIIMATALQVLISVAWIVVKPPRPIKDYSTFPDQIILKCSEMGSLGSIAEIFYIGFLCVVCFIFCYMGKDLPENYNEAKFISFSLLVYVFSWIGFFTTYIVYQGKYIVAVNVGAILLSILGILIGYFTPKCYIILFRPETNTAEHFKTAIQSYTMKQSAQE